MGEREREKRRGEGEKGRKGGKGETHPHIKHSCNLSCLPALPACLQEESATEMHVLVWGETGAFAIDALFSDVDGARISSFLVSSELSSFGVGVRCTCASAVTALRLHLTTAAPAPSATSWVAWPASGHVPYTLLPHNNVFSFHWPGVSLAQVGWLVRVSGRKCAWGAEKREEAE